MNVQYYTNGTPVFDTVEWETRDVAISGENGQNVFEQKGIRVPKSWSQLASQIVASKYFAGKLGTPEREDSIETMITRVTSRITSLGYSGGYFHDESTASWFQDELTYIILHQMATFNSPVWFNIGVEGRTQQASACFILNVEDDIDSILKWYGEEGKIFKGGSGAGVNLSKIRASSESLSGGGYASGPVSFMRGADSIAGGIKSGGTTRRAAKMVILNVDHPDIEEFILCKSVEEEKAYALGREGYDMSFDGDAWISIQFQNANNSVRVDKHFLSAARNDETWDLTARDGTTIIPVSAKDLLYKMAEAAWKCGDPGIQYDDNINDWHTTPNTGRINASNPCSEYMHLDNSACNLASINLLKFYDGKEFMSEGFQHVVDTMILAQEILVGTSDYPTPEIEAVTKSNRQLGLGYANLGALLMSMGIPYDSDKGREIAASITSLMSATAYTQSSRIAQQSGTFHDYPDNRLEMLKVIEKHYDASRLIKTNHISRLATAEWEVAVKRGTEFGFRNAQVTVLAPTGTIAFMMDCDTTGIEPDISLIKYKKLVGGGTVKITNGSVRKALESLGYDEVKINSIVTHIENNDTIEGEINIKESDLPVFDCAFKSENGTRSIHHMGHVNMMAAVQPFLSGAISKTINMPESATIADIEEVYMLGSKLGLKSLAIYRDNSKKAQPLTTNNKKEEEAKVEVVEKIVEVPRRRRLEDTRESITHKFDIQGHEGYMTIGHYQDGTPGELFIHMSKEGSTISGLMDAFATSVSVALQYGVPLDHLIKKFSHARFEPSGFTGNKQIPIAKSPIDYIFRWIEKMYVGEQKEELTEEQEEYFGNHVRDAIETIKNWKEDGNQSYEDSPSCSECGNIMKRSGTCYTCMECGGTSGCS